MHEDVFATVIADDEAEALLRIEKFDDAFAFANDLGRHAATAAAAEATAPAAAAETATAAATAEAITAAAVATATAKATASTAAAEAAALLVAIFTEIL
ncbi:MAG TPA: hypothetical protein VJS63_03160 [Bradyrhizobium sp.]|nr:hypothetical protein [Bradyrhizobium sp.]